MCRCQFSLESVFVHRKMERREEDEETKEKEEVCDDDTQGDDDEETAERSDANMNEAEKDGDVGEDEGSDRCKEENDEDGESDFVKKRVSMGHSSRPGQKCVPGILYLGHIPPRLRPKHLRNMMSPYGEVGRIFLQPEGTEAFPLSCRLSTLSLPFFCVALSEKEGL